MSNDTRPNDAPPALGVPMFDAFGHLFATLSPQPGAGERTDPVEEADDTELFGGTFDLVRRLVDGLGPVVAASLAARGIDDPTWLHPWPTTVETFVRSVFMTSLDSCATAAVVLHGNSSAAATEALRTVAESHVVLRWVLEPIADDEQRSRVLAITGAAVNDCKSALTHWERHTADRGHLQQIAHMRESLRTAQLDLALLAKRNNLVMPNCPSRTALMDRYFPGTYAMFVMLASMNAQPGYPIVFYGNPAGAFNWDYTGLDIERAYWLSLAGRLQLETCRLVAEVCHWSGHEPLLDRTEAGLQPIEAETARRFEARRAPRAELV